MTKTFPEVISGIRTAKKGVEVREDIAQMGEYVEQFAATATQKADAAAASEKKASDAVANIDQQKADSVAAVQQAQTTATTAITQTKDAALTDIGNAKTGALQEVASSTEAAQTAATEAKASKQAAEKSKEAAATSASTAATKAGEASTSAGAASTSRQAAEKAQKAAEDAAALAGTRAGTDKTLSIENAPADAAAVGDIILDRTKETPQPIFYSKVEVDKLLEDCKEAAKRAALLAANPVGKLWASDDPTSPASIVGGIWEQIKDRFILAAGDTYAGGSTGGSENHNHSIGDLFAAAYYMGDYIEYHFSGNAVWSPNYKNTFPGGVSDRDTSGITHFNGITVYGSPTKEANNLPPYVAMYVWKRIA